MKLRKLLFVVAMVLAVTAAAKTPAKPNVHIPPKARAPIRGMARPHSLHSNAVVPRLMGNYNLNAKIVAEDHGNIAVLHDDGTLVIPENIFDLQNMSLVFTPQGSGYTVQTVTPTFINPGANAAVLSNLDNTGYQQLTLPFTFNFYGSAYKTAFLNAYGNVTFGTPDINDFYLDLQTLMSGQPRIAPLFDVFLDEFDGGTGEIAAESFSDHVNIYFLDLTDYVTGYPDTFEMTLQSNGVIAFNYQGMGVGSAVVGLSPGQSTSFTATDFSQQSSPLAFSNTISEVFSPYTDIDLQAIGLAFYQSHPDQYDGFMAFADFPGLSVEEGWPYAQQVQNATQGVSESELFDYSTFFGSATRLFITGDVGSVDEYPSDPTQVFLGPHSTNTLIGQTFGHAWMSYVDTNPPSLLGLPGLWSFVMDAQGSVMEGNTLTALGNNQFQTGNATYHYSPLDEYLMGLRAPTNVPSWTVVQNPSLVSAPSDFSCSPFGAACYAENGVVFSGTPETVTLQNVIANVGARVPSYTSSQKNFNVAFILVTEQGQAVNTQNLAQLDNMRQAWQQWFGPATDNLGSVSTALTAFAPTVSSISPNQGPTVGGAAATITGTNFQASSTVTFGGVSATVTSASATSLQVVIPANNAGAVTVVVTNPDGQNASTSFTYSNQAVTQIQQTLAANGSVQEQTLGTAGAVSVGYGVVSPGTGVAVIQSYTNGNLVSEAAIPPTAAANQWVMYAEYDGPGAGIRTGVAIANPSSTTANLTLTLSNGTQVPMQLAPGAQTSKFVDEIFPNLTSFLGTMTVQSSAAVSIVALRETTNANGQFIISTIPLSSGSVATGGFLAFPIVADGGTNATGGNYTTDIILVNPGTTTSSGTINLFGFPSSVQTDAGTNTTFAFTIPAGGMYRLQTSGTPATETSGFASIVPTASSPTPNATAIIRLSSGGNLISETAIPAQTGVSNAMMFGSLESSLRTGIAMLNGNGQAATVTLTPLNANGQPLTGGSGNITGTVTVPAYSNVSKFLDEMIPTLPVGFEGTVLVQSTQPVFAISLRGTSTINGFLMSTTPVLNLADGYGGTYYFPQVVDGGAGQGTSYTTDFLMMNAGSANVQIQFFDQTGKPLPLNLKN